MPWDLAGSIGSALIGAHSAAAINRKQLGASRAQMDFQERMANTAYQRGMADMRQAGLNPILAYKQGGASSPGGAQPPQFRDPAQSGREAMLLSANVATALEQARMARLDRIAFEKEGMGPQYAQTARTISGVLGKILHSVTASAKDPFTHAVKRFFGPTAEVEKDPIRGESSWVEDADKNWKEKHKTLRESDNRTDRDIAKLWNYGRNIWKKWGPYYDK